MVAIFFSPKSTFLRIIKVVGSPKIPTLLSRLFLYRRHLNRRFTVLFLCTLLTRWQLAFFPLGTIDLVRTQPGPDSNLLLGLQILLLKAIITTN